MKRHFLLNALMYMAVLPAGHTHAMVIHRNVNLISEKKNNQSPQNNSLIKRNIRFKRKNKDNQKNPTSRILFTSIAIGTLVIAQQVSSSNPPPVTGLGGTSIPPGPPGAPGGIPKPPGLDTRTTDEILAENDAFAKSHDIKITLPP